MKRISIIGWLFLILLTSCKKEKTSPDPIINNTNNYNINYKNWQPDSIIYNNDSLIVNLDMDYNIIIRSEKQVYAGSTPSGGAYYNTFRYISSLDTNVFVTCGKKFINISTNDWINDSLEWKSEVVVKGYVVGLGFMGWWDHSSSQSTIDGYIAIKIVSDIGNKYGWIKLDPCINQSKLIIQEQAINNNHNQFIKAGQIN